MSRLYIVEGLPCSGKSSTARAIAEMLRAKGRNVICIDEGTGDHPADYEFHALTDGRIVPLTECPPDRLTELLPFKIYDGLPWETEAPLMLDKWRQFVREAAPDTAYVFNCVLMQNPMCETMMRFNLPTEASAAHIRQISEIIAPMEPTVVYLHLSDIARRVRETAAERPGWLETVIPYHTDGGYGRSIGAHGFDGCIDCLAERQRREESILHRLPVHAVTLHDPHRNWADAASTLHDLLNGGMP